MSLSLTNLSGALQSFINGQAQKQASSMGLPLQLSGSASSSASTGPAQSGDITGGTAFNIGGINLGQQYQAPATAGGGAGPDGNPSSILGSGASLSISPTVLIIAAVGALALFLILRRG